MNDFWLPTGLEKYVYLASLETGSPPEKELAQFIKRELVFKNDLSAPDTDFYENVNNALIILKQIADSEKSKEQQTIATYKQKIEKFIQDPEIPIKLKEHFNQQLILLNQVYTGINQKEINLIKDLNLVEQDLNLFQRRIQEINAAKIDPSLVWNTLEYRQEEQLDNFFKYLITNQSSKGKKIKNENIANTLKKIIKETIGSTYNDIPGFQELLLGLLYIDFMDQIQNNFNLDIYKLTIDDLKAYLKQYYKNIKNEKERSNLINLLINNTEESKHLINDFSSFLGVEFIDNKEYNKLKKKIEIIQELKKQNKTASEITAIIGQSEQQIKDRIKMYENSTENADKVFTIRMKNATSHGLLNEIRRIIDKNGIDVGKNVGIDNIIPLCTFSLNADEQYIQKELLSVSRDISNILGDAFTKNQQNSINLETLKDAIEQKKLMNQQIQKKIENSGKKIYKAKGEISNTFLSFESLKLSRTHEMEQSINEDYKGRTMNILSALTKLYAAPGFSQALMNLDTLIIFLLNISKNTLGSQNKPSLETYLSLFAGILMFDDVSNIAADALKKIAKEIPLQGTTDILHVYGINNIYFPISIILNNLIIQVETALQSQLTLSIDSNKTAKAHIIQPSPSFNGKNSTEEDWHNLSNKTLQSTKIQLGFLAGFTNYIGDLSKAISIQ